MQFVIGLVVLAIFWAVAPRPFIWLFKATLVLAIGGYLLLRLLALVYGATKGGSNAGMFEEEGLVIALLLFGLPVIMVVGIVSGALMRHLRSREERK